MANYALGILGIAVSVLLFLLGYRQTIGAKKERIKTANSHLESILVRRVVLEKHTPTQTDLSRLIEGKARDHNVSIEDLLSDGQLLNSLYTRITESDLIPAEQREEILHRLAPIITKLELEDDGPHKAEYPDGSSILKGSETVIALFAVTTSLLGGLIAIFPQIRNEQVEPLYKKIVQFSPVLSVTIVTSLSIMAALYAFFRLRASQEQSNNRLTERSSFTDFATEFRRIVRSVNGTFTPDQTFTLDAILSTNGKKIGLDLKNWAGPIPIPRFRQSVERIKRDMQELELDRGVFVTKGRVQDTLLRDLPINVEIVELSRLKSYLKTINRG